LGSWKPVVLFDLGFLAQHGVDCNQKTYTLNWKVKPRYRGLNWKAARPATAEKIPHCVWIVLVGFFVFLWTLDSRSLNLHVINLWSRTRLDRTYFCRAYHCAATCCPGCSVDLFVVETAMCSSSGHDGEFFLEVSCTLCLFRCFPLRLAKVIDGYGCCILPRDVCELQTARLRMK
jgi:hypothetical protein